MCGIVGYVGPQPALDVMVEGLRRLEYRGYDSAGVAIVADSAIHLAKKAGKISNLDKVLAEDPLPRSGLGLGHTRWATHGAPNDVNAHPHLSAGGRVALVHNGIIENYVTLSAELHQAGVTLTSQTDTEIVAHLLGLQVAAGKSLADAMRTVCARLQGAFTLVAVDSTDPDHVVAARRNSPLVVGVGVGENFVASDVAAFIEHTREAIELGQDQVVEISAAEIVITDFDGSTASVRPYHVDWDLSAAEKGGYDWFMRKEIYEQPKAVADTLLGRHDAHGKLTLDEIRIGEAELRAVDKIVVVACGTAFYAGLVAKYAIEHWTRIPCEVELASEFRYRDPIVGPATLVVAISQSGETADTLMAIRHTREQRARVLKIAADFADEPSVLFLGRHVGYPVALEGALKLKELAYIHAEGFAAGELKHGPIALIEDGLPVFCVVPPRGRDQLHDKMISAIQEIRARGARTIVLAEEGDESIAAYADELIRLPKVPTLLQPVVAVVPLQLFACELATRMGHDVDQPRNLA